MRPSPQIHPFAPTKISFPNVNYLFRRKLLCDQSFEDGETLITNEQLDITVWGATQIEAEEAFTFAFHSHVTNYASEPDEKLTLQAQQLKSILNDLIINTLLNNETKKDKGTANISKEQSVRGKSGKTSP